MAAVATLEELTAGARKTADGSKVSATDVIMVVKKCNRNNASKILRNLRAEERIPKLSTAIFGNTTMLPNRGGNRHPEAAADARQIVQVLWALPGDSEFRKNSASVVVLYVGGDPRMVEEVISIRRAQEVLREEQPDHPARFFGETVERELCGEHDERSPITELPTFAPMEEAAQSPPAFQCPPALRHPAITLPEACLNWVKDLGVSRQELSGVRSQFKSIVRIEISAGQLPQRSPVEEWAKAPPLLFRELAQSAVSSYRWLLARSSQTIVVGCPAITSDKKRRRAVQDDSSEGSNDDDDDILKISEVMRVAGVWKAVWSSFRSDLANQMLSLKCADTEGSFSARRPETVRGNVPVLVHKYKKSADWPLAWRALQNTRDVYEKRIREFLEDMYRVACQPDMIGPSSAQLARSIAASLRVAPGD
jgi:hypothetical protein